MSTAQRRKLSRQLHRFLYSERRFVCYLDEDQGSWTSGSCWRLAGAFRLWARAGGTRVQQVAIWNDRGRAEHVLVRSGDCYLDGDGISTLDEIVHRWDTLEGVSVRAVSPVTDRWLRDNHPDYLEPDESMQTLVAELQERFGDLGKLLRSAGC